MSLLHKVLHAALGSYSCTSATVPGAKPAATDDGFGRPRGLGRGGRPRLVGRLLKGFWPAGKGYCGASMLSERDNVTRDSHVSDDD